MTGNQVMSVFRYVFPDLAKGITKWTDARNNTIRVVSNGRSFVFTVDKKGNHYTLSGQI